MNSMFQPINSSNFEPEMGTGSGGSDWSNQFTSNHSHYNTPPPPSLTEGFNYFPLKTEETPHYSNSLFL